MALTNEQKRQQSGRDMEESRRASGRNMEESRRASGRKMRDDMRALAENNRLERTLPELPVRGKQPSKRGSAVWSGGAPSSAGGGGIASPLEEVAGSREYYTSSRITVSNTFLEAMEVRMLKTINFTDADNNSVALNFSDVVAP